MKNHMSSDAWINPQVLLLELLVYKFSRTKIVGQFEQH